MNAPDTYLLTCLTLAEYRKFKAALAVLKAAGVQHDEAVHILLTAVHVQRSEAIRERIERTR